MFATYRIVGTIELGQVHHLLRFSCLEFMTVLKGMINYYGYLYAIGK